ncbi:uncharacterized protein METZ01_LOCUS142516, partial [marine metagenome]
GPFKATTPSGEIVHATHHAYFAEQ